MIDYKGVITSIIGALVSSLISVIYDIIKNSISNVESETDTLSIFLRAMVIAIIVFIFSIIVYNEINKKIEKNNFNLSQKEKEIENLENKNQTLNNDINKLHKENDTLLADLKHYKDLYRKSANLISQLKGVESAKVRKIFNEFNRTPYEKLFEINLDIIIEIIKTDSGLYNVNYIWRFKGKALKDISMPTFKRGITSDQNINRNTLDLCVTRKINNKEVEFLNNDDRGYNIKFFSYSKADLDLEVFIAKYLRKNDIFEIVISYTLVNNYNPQGDFFDIFPFTFDDAICQNMSIEIVTHENIVTDALLEYINEGNEMIDSKTMQKIGNKYSLMFNPNLDSKKQGFYKITTSKDGI